MGSNYKTVLSTGRHTIIGDEPLSMEGSDMGMNPFDLLLSSLAACKVMTLRWYAKKNNFPLDGVDAVCELETNRSKSGTLTKVHCILTIKGNLSDDQRHKLLAVADKCPVHRALHGTFDIASEMK